MKNDGFWKGVATGGLAVVLLLAAAWLAFSRNTVLADPSVLQKLSYLEQIIDRDYLEEKDEDMIAEGLYKGLLAGLGDPYSGYYTAEEYKQQNSDTLGEYRGIGVLLQKNQKGGVRVAKCYEGGPAEKAGVEEGDIISAIDGTDITEMEVADVVQLVQEKEKGSMVLTIHKENVEEVLELTVEIDDVELPSVFSEMLDERTGYIRISEFKGVTPKQFEEAFSNLKNSGMEQLVVDLRDNPGGLLDAVCDTLRQILPKGLIVYTEDKYGEREEITCDGETPIDIPLAVLVNEGSASASEIFAGAVQDYGVGTIVGTTTYGKGIVQVLRPLADGSAVKLTVSRYYTPNGNSIHETGIQPDVEVQLDSSLLNKEEFSHEEDNQLQEALRTFNLQ